MLNLAELLEIQARQRPQQMAFIDGPAGRERSISFGRMNELSIAAAERMSRCGIHKGSRVLVLVPMKTELYITLSALWRLGAIALFLDPSAPRQQMSDFCTLVQPDALIGIPKARLLVWTTRALLRIPSKLYWGRQLRMEMTAKQVLNIASLPENHPAILTFTSGSTGKPKAAIRTHALLFAQYQALKEALLLKPGDLDMATMPVIALVNIAAGLTTLIPAVNLTRPGFIRATRLLQQITNWNPIRCTASPAFLLTLCEAARQNHITLPVFEKIYTGGAPVFPRTLRIYASIFSRACVRVLYGSTEAEPISELDIRDISSEDQSIMQNAGGLLVGAVCHTTKLRILPDRWGTAVSFANSEELDNAALPAGEIGEIIVSGEHVIPGYWNGQGDGENKIHTDNMTWHRTGDAGYLDTSGRLWLMGRCSAKFQVQGKTVYPFSIECAAVEHFDVRIAGCVRTDKGYILALPSSARKATGHFLPQIPAPEKIVFLKQIPVDKRHNAKIDYQALAKACRS